VRHVTTAVKRRVYASYGVVPRQGYCSCPQGCEVDHLISLELGGSNEQANLWPQPFCGEDNAHMKDQLENKLHQLVCDRTLELSVAQDAISSNWIDAYNTYVASGDYEQ